MANVRTNVAIVPRVIILAAFSSCEHLNLVGLRATWRLSRCLVPVRRVERETMKPTFFRRLVPLSPAPK